uniref:DH domain-containing protein n=1 Tax=Heterorhabditis bacteriophora TaxID=37862 RepID=A0A1I7X0B5_HETBA
MILKGVNICPGNQTDQLFRDARNPSEIPITTCDLFLRGYDPITVAASLHLRLPFNMIRGAQLNDLCSSLGQSSKFDDAYTYYIYIYIYIHVLHQRNTLDNISAHIYFCFPIETTIHHSQLIPFVPSIMSRSAIIKSEPERIYSVKQILTQNHDLIDRGRMSMRVPRIYIRSKDDHMHQQIVVKRLGSVGADAPFSQHLVLMVAEVAVAAVLVIVLAEASWDHVAILPDELPFASGDVITILDSSSQVGLWFGSCRDSQGWFPASHVRLLSSAGSRTSSTTILGESEFPKSLRTQRANVIEELLTTERDYVRLLEDIVQGFLEQTRRRRELFSTAKIKNIFGNIQSIYIIHSKLLRDLEMALDQNSPEHTNVGAAFLRNKHSFAIYSDYCNNRPVSCAELAQLSRQPVYRQFFEATPSSHEDYTSLEAAKRAMSNVAAHINDRKRRIEALQDIARWQKNVHGWRGPDLLENNSVMLHSGEAYCRYMINGHHQWTKVAWMTAFEQRTMPYPAATAEEKRLAIATLSSMKFI